MPTGIPRKDPERREDRRPVVLENILSYEFIEKGSQMQEGGTIKRYYSGITASPCAGWVLS